MHTFTARPHPARRRLLLSTAVVVFFTLWQTVGAMFGAVAATNASISGTAFQDLNRDGVQQHDEPGFPDHVIYLFDGNGTWVASDTTDADGRYDFGSLPAGDYAVEYMRNSWTEVWSDWVPTTTGSLRPQHRVTVGDEAVVAPFGWRPIAKSDDVHNPISEVTGPEGLRVQSYNDVISAQQIHDHIVSQFHVGDEAPTTTVRFAYRTYNTAQTSTTQQDGEITQVRSTIYTTYERWLTGGDRTLAHEYGHAWTNYHNFFVQQDVDKSWHTYLQARGIDPNDERLGSSHAWMPGEIAADDYRILLTSDSAATSPHMNYEIAEPGDVAGFESWMRDTFTSPPGSTGDGTGSVDTNSAPTANVDTSCADLSCLLDGSGSTDPDGHVVGYAWDLGDGSTATGSEVEHAYAEAGSYTLTLTVTDDDGAAAQTQVTVEVSEPSTASTQEPSEGEDTTLTTATVVPGSTNGRGSWTAWVDVTVVVDGAPASGTTVAGDWAADGKHGGSGTIACTTAADGTCRLAVAQENRVGAVDWTIETAAGSAVARSVKP